MKQAEGHNKKKDFEKRRKYMRSGIGEKDECQCRGYSSVQDCWSDIGSENKTLISKGGKKQEKLQMITVLRESLGLLMIRVPIEIDVQYEPSNPRKGQWQ